MSVNIDALCAEKGFEIGENETLINKCLGVLVEQGVYALFLFLTAKEKKNDIAKKIWNFLKEEKIGVISTSCFWDEKKWHDNLKNELLGNLDKLIFARNILEQTLIYARYHAKARGN